MEGLVENFHGADKIDCVKAIMESKEHLDSFDLVVNNCTHLVVLADNVLDCMVIASAFLK
jgi:hypothetical protein